MTRIEKLEAELSRRRSRFDKTFGLAAIGALAGAVLLWPGDASSQSGTCSVPNCFVAGEPAVADDVNENFDFVTALTRTGNTTLFEASGTENFTLTNDNTFHDVQDLTVTFSVEQSTAIIANYNFSLGDLPPDTNSHVVTQLVLDDVVVDESITGNTRYIDNDGVYLGRVDAGEHTLTVRYRTPAPTLSNAPASDWNERRLSVLVLGDAE